MVEDGYDDCPLLDFELSGEVGTSGIYAEDQIVMRSDGPASFS